jgi:putative ABC transport system substrate-binding protein
LPSQQAHGGIRPASLCGIRGDSEAAPKVSRIALLFNPETAPFAEGYLHSARAAAQTLGATVISVPCSNDADIQGAFTARARERNGGIIGIADTLIADH